ncbi:MAG: cupredoxin domain-containing protein [Gemmatimonadaceae bacterium]
MRLVRIGVALASAAFLAACGGGSNGGTNPPPVTATLGSIVPSTTTMSLNAGQRQTISMQARDVNNQLIASASGYTFSSSASAVAVVSTNGAVTAVSAGAATITVSLTLSGVTKTATVAVTVTGMLPLTATVAAGATTQTFEPDFVAVGRGGSVTWTFGGLAHNVEFGGTPGAPAGIGNSTNTSVGRTFNTSGTFAYTCTLHANMNGTVLVP